MHVEKKIKIVDNIISRFRFVNSIQHKVTLHVELYTRQIFYILIAALRHLDLVDVSVYVLNRSCKNSFSQFLLPNKFYCPLEIFG